METHKAHGFLCVTGENDERLYLAPHGLDNYRIIGSPIGAAIFEKSVALHMIDDNQDLFYVPIDINTGNLTTITDANAWHQMNAPK